MDGYVRHLKLLISSMLRKIIVFNSSLTLLKTLKLQYVYYTKYYFPDFYSINKFCWNDIDRLDLKLNFVHSYPRPHELSSQQLLPKVYSLPHLNLSCEFLYCLTYYKVVFSTVKCASYYTESYNNTFQTHITQLNTWKVPFKVSANVEEKKHTPVKKYNAVCAGFRVAMSRTAGYHYSGVQ
jgi:hypothetical protein